jgi:hypothetical protein
LDFGVCGAILWRRLLVDFFGLVAEAAGGMGLAFVVEVEVVFGGAWVAYMLDRTEALASVPAGEEY